MDDSDHKLFNELCSYRNIFLAYGKARKGKTSRPYVVEFEKDLEENLMQLRTELLLHSYRPKPLKTFILRDPKTRRISKSAFRDRIVHHALCNIIEPIFDKTFIYDSYANRLGKGTLKAIQRFDCFKRKVSQNNSRFCFVLKADIKHYFERVEHRLLLNLISKQINDAKIVWLTRTLLENHSSQDKGKGMPLGNLTSQFFANIYLNELDQFVKHKLRAKYYIRYVDDFVIMERNKANLREYKTHLNKFLKTVELELHPDKSKINPLNTGAYFLGFKIFYFYKLMKKSSIRKMRRKLINFEYLLEADKISYDKTYMSFEGWLSHAIYGNTSKLRRELVSDFDRLFKGRIADVEINRWLKIYRSKKTKPL